MTNWGYMVPLAETDEGETEELLAGIVEVNDGVLSKIYESGFGIKKTDFSDMPFDSVPKISLDGEDYVIAISDMSTDYSEVKEVLINEDENITVRIYYCTENDMILGKYDFELKSKDGDFSVISMKKVEDE